MKVRVRINGVVNEPNYPLTRLCNMLEDIVDSMTFMEYQLDDKVIKEFPITMQIGGEDMSRLTIELALVELEDENESA